MMRARISSVFLGLVAAAAGLCAGCGGDEFQPPPAGADPDDAASSGEGGAGDQGAGGADNEGGSHSGSGEGGSTGQGGATGQGGSEPSGCTAGETRSCYSGPAGSETVGACLAGIETCDADGSWGACVGEVLPAAESCGTPADDDCDGEINQGCACVPGVSETCYSGPAGTQNVGTCKAGTHTCDATGTAWGACLAEVLPAVEDCANPADEDCSGVACAQTMWSKIAGDGSYQSVADVAVDGAGNIYVAGSFQGTINLGGGPLISSGDRDIYLAKLDASGAHLWSKSFGDSSPQEATSMAVNAAGTVALVGAYQGTFGFGGTALSSNTSGYNVGFFAKLDSNGNHVFTQKLAQSPSQASAVAIDAAGRVVIGGSFSGCWKTGFGGFCATSTAGQADGFVISYSAANTWQWNQIFGNASNQVVNSVAFDPAGNVIFAASYEGTLTVDGTSHASSGSTDILVAKLDAAGNYAWTRKIGGAYGDEPSDLIVDPSGNAVLLAQFDGTVSVAGKSLASKGEWDVLLVQLSSAGTLTSAKSFGGPTADRAESLARDADGNLLLAASTMGSIDFGGGPLASLGSLDAMVAKLDASGGHLWSKRFGDASAQASSSIATMPSKELVLGAMLQGTTDFGAGAVTSAGNYDVAVAKIAP
jgi:hypothetical protein